MRLYQTGGLDFLRRLDTIHIPEYKAKPDFIQEPMARFDYVGFGPELADQPELRKALSLSLDYKQLKKLLYALGRPGCPSLAPRLLAKIPCYNFNLKTARQALQKVGAKIRSKRWSIYYSQMGGPDVAKTIEWMQNQWKVNLGLKIDMKPQEQGVYLGKLRYFPPALFKKGVGVDRPTCLAAAEVFESSYPENFIRLKSKKYDRLIRLMRADLRHKYSKSNCTKAVSFLLDHYLIIPMGQIHFTMLATGKFTGWRLNELNQLDLSSLERVK